MDNNTRADTAGELIAAEDICFGSEADFAIGKEIVYVPSAGGQNSEYSFERYMLASTDIPLAFIDGWPINLANQRDTIDAVMAAARRGEGFSLFTLNLDHLVKLRSCTAFRRAYMYARFVTADGAPVARIAARQDGRVERTTGADLIVPLAQRAAKERIPIYLFGTNSRAIGRAAADLVERCDGRLDIAGSASPPFGFDPEGPDADAAIDRIEASGARICFVALGAPKQELFAARAAARGVKVGFVCIGAALDFLAGEQLRAPDIMQRSGLEWMWRLATSPRRLAKRYLLCALVLADITLLAPVRGAIAGLGLVD